MAARRALAATAASCLILTACGHLGESPAANPPADSFRTETFELRIGDATEKVNGASVTGAFFRETKTQPVLGRLFLDEEYQTARTGVVLLSDSLWQRRFGGDPKVIGSALTINQQQRTVVGILPKTFQFPPGAEVWIPLHP
jgi:hypothetical protein